MIKNILVSIKGLFKSKQHILANDKIIAPSPTLQKGQSIKEVPSKLQKKLTSKKLRKSIDKPLNQHVNAKNKKGSKTKSLKKSSSKRNHNHQATLDKINEVKKPTTT